MGSMNGGPRTRPSSPLPRTVEPLFTARIGALVQKAFVIATNTNGTAPGRYRINWPWGRMAVYRDRIDLKVFFSEFSIPIEDVERIERHMLFLVRIHHKSDEVPAYVAIWGWNLMAGLRNVARQHRLPLRTAA